MKVTKQRHIIGSWTILTQKSIIYSVWPCHRRPCIPALVASITTCWLQGGCHGVQVLHGLASPYLNQLARVADLPRRRQLRSASSHQLLVPPFRLTTVGRRTFPVAASLLWNSLPSNIQASSSLSAFRRRLKTFLFRQSFPDIVLWSHYIFVVYAIVFAILATLKIIIDIDSFWYEDAHTNVPRNVGFWSEWHHVRKTSHLQFFSKKIYHYTDSRIVFKFQ